jgi:hypothetical protein
MLRILTKNSKVKLTESPIRVVKDTRFMKVENSPRAVTDRLHGGLKPLDRIPLVPNLPSKAQKTSKVKVSAEGVITRTEPVDKRTLMQRTSDLSIPIEQVMNKSAAKQYWTNAMIDFRLEMLDNESYLKK